MLMGPNKHIGSSLDSFLEEEGVKDECEAAAIKSAQIRALADAVLQVLDDMGDDGLSCCEFAKAQLRIAYEPFRDDSDGLTPQSLEKAKLVIAACDYRSA